MAALTATQEQRKRPTCRAEFMSDILHYQTITIYAHTYCDYRTGKVAYLWTQISASKNECIMIHNDGSDRLVSGESIPYAKSATLMVAQAS